MRGSRGDLSHVVRYGDYLQRLSVDTALSTLMTTASGERLCLASSCIIISHTGLYEAVSEAPIILQ